MSGAAESNAILWLSPSGAREWLRAGWRASSKSVMAMLGVGAGIAIGAGYTMTFYLRQREQLTQAVEPAGDLAVFGVFTLFLIILLGVPALALTITGALFVPRLTLTADELHMAPRFPWRRITIVPRTEIRSAEIYEGDGTVILLGDGGELLRIGHVTGPAAFAEALAAPALAWPQHKSSKVVDLMFGVVVVACAPLTAVNSVAVIAVTYRLYELVSGPVPEQGMHFEIFVATLFAGMIMAVPIAIILAMTVSRWFVSPGRLAEFILFCRDNDRWHGRTPTRWNLTGRLFAGSTRLAARIARIPPPPPLQPELRHGMTPEMAALVEGAG